MNENPHLTILQGVDKVITKNPNSKFLKFILVKINPWKNVCLSLNPNEDNKIFIKNQIGAIVKELFKSWFYQIIGELTSNIADNEINSVQENLKAKTKQLNCIDDDIYD